MPSLTTLFRGRIRWAGNVECMGKMRIEHSNLVGETNLMKEICDLPDNIKVNLSSGICLAGGRNWRSVAVNTKLTLPVLKICVSDFLTC